MGDRSDEAVRDAPIEDVIEETDQFLSGDVDGDDRDRRSPDEPGTTDDGFDLGLETGGPREDDDEAGSAPGWRSRLRPSRSFPSRLSLSRYFSPKSYLALVAALGAGFAAGGFVPLVGWLGARVGLFVAAFLVGLIASRRRYLEVGAAGLSVGAVAALVGNAVIAIAGSATTVAAVGVGTGLLASLVGYYFGRDLRAGLTRDV